MSLFKFWDETFKKGCATMLEGISGRRFWAALLLLAFTLPTSTLPALPAPAITRVQAVTSRQVASSPAAATTSPQRALLNQYCVTCHNEKLQTAGLILDRIDVEKSSGNSRSSSLRNKF